MAATKTAKNPTSRNDTPATPSVSESKIARMKVDELRRELTNHGVKGTADLKKPDLVKKLIKAATKSATKSSASRNDTPATPEVSESKIAARKADELRRELRKRGVKGTAELKKPDLVKKMIELETAGATSSAKASAGKASAGKAVAGKTSVGKASAGRTSAGKASAGKASSAGAKKGKGGAAYAQEISSTADKPERNGRSLVTTDHAVIRQWAKARGAKPATVPDTEHDGHLGVLRLDFPGYRGDRLVEVSWNDWFDAFDKRGLHFIFQQRLASGRRSNFFQLENPDE